MMEAAVRRGPRTVRLGSREYPVVGPDLRDPRLHVALVVVSLQVLGQTLLRFDVSITQIAVAISTGAVLELVITLRRERALVWPASALLTGNGVAFVLRVTGTEHGDWWSLRGWWIFAAVAGVSVLSKYLIRVDGRPLFNPSNFGLLLGFMLLGSRRVDPLDFWWVRPGVALALALTVIVVGGLFLAWRVKMLGVVSGFWLTYAVALGVLAARGHCITARWHVGPVCNQYFWSVLVTSPEVLVFMFFMITDPKTVPRGRRARVVYGVAIALVFVAFAAPQTTEFATKVALLAALALVCAVRPLLERLFPLPAPEPVDLAAAPRLVRGARDAVPRSRPATVARRVRRAAVLAVVSTAYAALVVGAGAPASTSRVAAATVAPPINCTDVGSLSAHARPTVRTGALPTVRVVNTINVATSISPALANDIVRNVIDDLAIAAEAIEQRNPDLALEVGRYPWADSLISVICATSGALVVPTFRFAHATVTIAKRVTGQVFPEIDVTVQGDLRETTITRSTPHRRLAVHAAPFRNTFVVTKLAGFWLICGYRSDRRTSSCVTTL